MTATHHYRRNAWIGQLCSDFSRSCHVSVVINFSGFLWVPALMTRTCGDSVAAHFGKVTGLVLPSTCEYLRDHGAVLVFDGELAVDR